MLPPFNDSYEDEFGHIDPIVYQEAEKLWPTARELVLKILHDEHVGVQLMLRAVAKVSHIRANEPDKIGNLSNYLYVSLKHLVFAEQKKEMRHREIEASVFRQENINDKLSDEEQLNKKILIAELKQRMDDWTREVFDYIALGHTFDEISKHFDMKANHIRSKFSKRVNALARELQNEIKETDKIAKRK